MTRLVEALLALGLDGEVLLAGRWLRMRGVCAAVYVAESAEGGYYTWCDAPGPRSVHAYADPVDAIRAGLQRAAESA